jgi:PncC family amidohydrolase
MSHQENVLAIVRQLQLRRQTLAFAESCTGGLISHWMTQLPGVSAVYRGTIIAYHEELKEELLEVSSSVIEQFGVVSIQTAGEMARGARDRCQADWALSTTGIAGPSGGDEDNPVGTVCFFIAGPQIERDARMAFSGDRQTIQKLASEWALDWLMKTVTGKI